MVHDDAMNVTGKCKEIVATYNPSNIEEIISLVRSARLTGVPLYPVSKGFNWGYGSRSPVTGNCAVIDLGKLNQIRNAASISIDNPIAVIEPGVTQIQLYNFLQANCPELTFNVTGSGRDTSIIGNALDGGVGYYGPRREDLFGLEVITGTGEILFTGFRRLGESSPLAHCHPFGLGPDLEGLFFQSNFGIVTSACFRLYPKRPKMVAVSLALHKADDLPRFINELARLKRESLLTSVTHIANRARTRSTLNYGITQYLESKCNFSREHAIQEADNVLNIIIPAQWSSLASVSGSADQIKAVIREIRQRTRSFARLIVVTDNLLDTSYALAHRLRRIPFFRTHAAAISAMRPLHKLVLGVPTDIAIENLLWKFDYPNSHATELDLSRCGLLFINPALPLDGQFVTQVTEGMNLIAARFDHVLYITINVETATTLVAIVNLLFDRTIPDEVDRAHNCADALYAYMRDCGLELYRARSDMMEKIVMSDRDYWGRIFALKQVLDPDNIIAPGRYNISCE